MKCTAYYKGVFLDEDSVENVMTELRKDSKYKRSSKKDVEAVAREAIVLHNRGMNVQLRMAGNMLTYTENGSHEVKHVPIERVDIGMDGKITFRTHGETDPWFRELPNGEIEGNVSSEEAKEAIRLSPRYEDDLSTLFNTDGTEGAVDSVLSGVDLLDNDVTVIQSKLAELDKDATNSEWDSEHSGYLSQLNKRMHKLVGELSKVEIKVSKDAVMGLIEPMGEFDPTGGKSTVKVATADVSEQAKNRFIMGNEETFTHEYVHAYMKALNSKNLNTLAQEVRDDMRRLYAAAKKQLTYKDLLPEGDGPYSADEVTKAKEMFTYVFEGKYGEFSNKDANRRLEEFVAYGMTNKHMKAALEKVSLKYKEKVSPEDATWLGKLFYKAMNMLQEMLYKIRTKRGRGTNVDEELTRLAMKLGEINYVYGNKAKENIAFRVDSKMNKVFNGMYEGMDEQLQKVTSSVLKKTGMTVDGKGKTNEMKYLSNELIPAIQKAIKQINKGNPFMKTWGFIRLIPMLTKFNAVVNDSDKDEYLELRITIDEIMRKSFGKGHEFVKDLVADFSAGRKSLVEITDMTMRLKSHLDRMRDMYIKGTLKDIGVGFTKVDILSVRNKEYKQALGKVVMRTDFQAISTDAGRLEGYLNDSKKLDTDIKKLEKEIGSTVFVGNSVGKLMVANARKVATYMLTKKGLRSNANNIARNFGTALALSEATISSVKDYNVEDTEAKIDKLISMYALRDADYQSKAAMKDLIHKDKEGVSRYLTLAKGAQVAIKEDWYLNGMGHEMVKGQMRETTDANKDLVFAEYTPENKAKMKALGYKAVRYLKLDSGDKSGTPYILYSHTNTGMTRRVDGALGLQRLQVKGLLLSDKVRNDNQHLVGARLNNVVRKAIKEAVDNSTLDKMYPVYNDNGRVIDFRYEPTLEEMETHLDMEKRGTELLAMTFGQKSTQAYTDQSNKELIDVIFKDTSATIKQLKKSNSKKARALFDKEFIHVRVTENKMSKAELKKLGANDGDSLMPKTEGEELWGLLPPDARKYIIAINKQTDLDSGIIDPKNRKEIYIRRDLMKQLFGYNEMMLTDAKFFKHLSPETQNKLRQVENGIANTVQLAKNMVVIKLPRTIYGNIISNAKFLWFAGMPAKKAAGYMLLSKRSLDKWKKDERKRKDLERKIDTVEGKEQDKLRKELADLSIEMQDNPIMPLINEGLYQTIAEDVNLEDDNNAIVNWMENKIDESIVGKSKTMKEVVNTIFLTRRSVAGGLMLQVTQESDFHFRAASYWYMVENGTAKKKAIREVTDNFINYNKVINSKFIQWLDRMGPEAFWKYFSNIQRRNLKLVKENTTRVALDVAGKHWLDIPADTLDSSSLGGFASRFNPFNWLDNFGSLLEGGMNIPIKQVAEGL